MGEAAEVAGKGLRRIKIALASAWKPKPCHRSFQTLFPLAGHGGEPSLQDGFLKNNAVLTRAGRKVLPGAGGRGRHGPGPTTKPASWLRDHVYPQIPAPSHPDSHTLEEGGPSREGVGEGEEDRG